MTLEQPLAVALTQHRAAVEDVEEQIGPMRTLRRGADEKVAREVDALEPQPGPPADVHVDDRQRDRNAGAPHQHVVDEAVAGIVVVRLVAVEPEILEQVVVQGGDPILGALDQRKAAAGLVTHRRQRVEDRLRVDVAVLDRCEDERAADQRVAVAAPRPGHERLRPGVDAGHGRATSASSASIVTASSDGTTRSATSSSSAR